MEPSIWSLFRRRWRETRCQKHLAATLREIGGDLWEFLRESTPERKRLRYGDVEYDWDHHVDTTSATVSHRGRLIAALSGAPYQPTDPAEFREMMQALKIDFPEYTFVDLGSGKGRTLLMASEFSFRRIVGVELVRELHETAQRNIAAFSNPEQKCNEIESVCCDARNFVFPAEPILVYLFNPFPSTSLKVVIDNLRQSLDSAPRQVVVLYLNPMSENLLANCEFLRKVGGTSKYSVYSN